MIERLLSYPRLWAKRRKTVAEVLRTKGSRVHVGCNVVRVEGFINVDVRSTSATDLVHDCRDLSLFPTSSLDVVFSNAFFEHIYVSDRLRFLVDVARALKPEGVVAFTGLPDFEEVARAYLERRKPGHVSPVFDLTEAYRYTHGAPEGQPSWWLAQLHKGLLDWETLLNLSRDAGFASGAVFRYCWGQEAHPVTLGFVAYKRPGSYQSLNPTIRELLANLPTNINWNTAVELGRY